MEPMQLATQARAMRRDHGDEAEDMATAKARECDEAGLTDEATRWRAIRKEISALEPERRPGVNSITVE